MNFQAANWKLNMATQHNALLPLPPTPPEEWECCGSECGDACIYALYQQEKQRYEEQLQSLLTQLPQENEHQ